MDGNLNFITQIEGIMSIRRIILNLLVYFSIHRATQYTDNSRKIKKKIQFKI